MRFFNTSGPVVAAKHYCIPPLERLDLRGILQLVGRERYFVLHAPRQTGKTSILLALRDELNRSGSYRCVYVNVEVGQAAREDVGAATRSILNHTARRARSTLNDDFVANIWPETLARAGPYNALEEVLGRWAEADDKRPLVLLIDEIDALIGDTLLSVLRQLRAGYDQRPSGFPQSVVLCGVQGRARLPHPFLHREVHRHRRQRLQYQVRVPAAGGFLAAGSGQLCSPSTRGRRDRCSTRMPARRSGRSPGASRGW